MPSLLRRRSRKPWVPSRSCSSASGRGRQVLSRCQLRALRDRDRPRDRAGRHDHGHDGHLGRPPESGRDDRACWWRGGPMVGTGRGVHRGAAHRLPCSPRSPSRPSSPSASPGHRPRHAGIASNIQLGQAIALEAMLTFFLVSAVFGTCVNSGRAQGRRVRRGPGALVRHSGRRPAHRRGDEPRAGVRPGAGGRPVGGPHRVLGGADPRRDRGGAPVGARAAAAARAEIAEGTKRRTVERARDSDGSEPEREDPRRSMTASDGRRPSPRRLSVASGVRAHAFPSPHIAYPRMPASPVPPATPVPHQNHRRHDVCRDACTPRCAEAQTASAPRLAPPRPGPGRSASSPARCTAG